MSGPLLELSRPPLNVLLNPSALKRQKPWELNIVELLDYFIEVLRSSGRLDLHLCGSAALSSALIYRLKVETLFLFEKLRSERRMEARSDEVPLLLEMPFRYELYSTTLEDLLLALQRTLEQILKEGGKRERERERPVVLEHEGGMELEEAQVNIKERVEAFEAELLGLLGPDGMLFSDLVKGKELLEEVRTFLLLLFLAMEGVVSLLQEGDDIRILPSEGHELR